MQNDLVKCKSFFVVRNTVEKDLVKSSVALVFLKTKERASSNARVNAVRTASRPLL